MDSVWIENGRRSPLAHELALAVEAGLAARGLARSERNATMSVTADLEKTPAFKRWKGETLRRKYYEVASLPPPLS